MSELVIPQAKVEPPNENRKGYLCEACGREHTRITTLIDTTVPKYGLVPWAEKIGRAAGYAAAKANVPEPKAREWAQQQGVDADSMKEAGGDRGTALHDYLEAFVQSGEVAPLSDLDPAYRGYGQQLAKFLLDYEPEFHASEIYVVHCELDYAGRTDGIATITNQPPRRNKPWDLTGKRVLFDLKTNREGRVYKPAHLFQIAGYELALEAEGMEPTDEQVIVAVGEDKYQLAVGYYPPASFAALAKFYQATREAEALNPNARG